MKLKLIFLSLFSLNTFGAVLNFPPYILAMLRNSNTGDSSSDESASSNENSPSTSNQPTPEITIVKMPSAAVLKKRLLIKTGILIGEKTSLVEKLADKEIEPWIAASYIELAMGEYVDYIKAECQGREKIAADLASRARAKMPLIFAAVFEENPGCLLKLKNQGIAYALPPEKDSKS